MSDEVLIPGAPEVAEYNEAMRLAGITHADLVKASAEISDAVTQGTTQADATQQGASVVLNTEARDAANISAQAIEAARREVVRATNAIQSRFVMGIIPSIRQGDAG
jgi:hypothetical protein